MWVSVVIVFSFVFFGWLNSASNDFYALIHPEEAKQARVLAEAERQSQPSPFAAIGDIFGNIKGSLSGLLTDSDTQDDRNGQEDIAPQKLPVTN